MRIVAAATMYQSKKVSLSGCHPYEPVFAHPESIVEALAQMLDKVAMDVAVNDFLALHGPPG